MIVTPLSLDDLREIVGVFSDAFYDYPVMRHVVGVARPYDQFLGRLIELFASRRAYSGEPMLGVRDDRGVLIAAATMALPAGPDLPPRFVALRESTWSVLGDDARARYETFAAVTQRFVVASPHHYLDMIGVRRSHQGHGLARRLLEAVHDLASSDQRSSGVRLTTELAANVTLYEHFGYTVRGQARVADGLETWTLFRPTSSPRSDR